MPDASTLQDLYEAQDVDGLVHKVVAHMRGVLGHSSNQHVWYRVALSSSNNMAATIFDDLIQVCGVGWRVCWAGRGIYRRGWNAVGL
jgi:hypothetical protein